MRKRKKWGIAKHGAGKEGTMSPPAAGSSPAMTSSFLCADLVSYATVDFSSLFPSAPHSPLLYHYSMSVCADKFGKGCYCLNRRGHIYRESFCKCSGQTQDFLRLFKTSHIKNVDNAISYLYFFI